MRVRFWGTRGSLAKPGPTTLRYGGNTSCVEVRSFDNSLVVLDCGTGAHGLGEALLASGERPLRGFLLLTHTHWDHIQGFPFFGPLFAPGNQWDLYGPGGLGHGLEDALAGQMQYTYFPVTLNQLGANIRYHDIVEGSFELGPFRITARYLNHPALTLGYRLECGGASMVYATDHEPYSRDPALVLGTASSETGRVPTHLEEQRYIEFLSGADLVIHDSQYTSEEYPKKVGWGHSTAEYAVDVAFAARAKRLALFHHDPLRSDDALDRLVSACRARAAAMGSALEVFAAAEGQVVELEEARGNSTIVPETAEVGAVSPVESDATAKTVLVVDDDPDVVRLLMASLKPEGFRLLSAIDGDSALRIARAELPDLILLDWLMPGRDGLNVCRTLRAESDPQLRNVPVVLLTARASAEDTAAGFAAGATDYLTKPFSPALVRTKVRGWLLRVSVTGLNTARG